MLNLYTSPSCTSCRKAKAWLKEHDISFKERNIFANPLNKEEIMQVLRMTAFLYEQENRLQCIKDKRLRGDNKWKYIE